MNNKNIIQKVVLGGVVIKDNKILIVQRNMDEDVFPGLWELPSGKKEDLETAEASLVREVKEETGLDVLPVAPFDVFNYQIEKPDVIKDTTQVNYLVNLINTNQIIILSHEHQNYRWIGKNDLDLYNLSDSTKSALDKAFKNISVPLHSVIVNAVVEKDGKILVSQRSFEEAHEPGKWTIPGGKIEKTEGDVFNVVEKTCAREVEEETGVTIKNDVHLITNNTFIRSNGQHVIALICLCHWQSGKVQALEDTIGVKWISEDEIDSLEFAPNVKTYIQNGFSLVNRIKK